MTFRKVTPAALKVNVKKFWQVLLVPWHVWAPIWVHFAPWWSIFPVKNRFSHIFPVPGGLPFLTVILTVKLARLGRTQHKERRTSHLLEFAVGVSPRNALLLFLLLLLMMPLLPPESQFGMLPQILRVPRLYCSDPVFNPLFLNISAHSHKSHISSSPCVHFSLIQ